MASNKRVVRIFRKELLKTLHIIALARNSGRKRQEFGRLLFGIAKIGIFEQIFRKRQVLLPREIEQFCAADDLTSIWFPCEKRESDRVLPAWRKGEFLNMSKHRTKVYSLGVLAVCGFQKNT